MSSRKHAHEVASAAEQEGASESARQRSPAYRPEGPTLPPSEEPRASRIQVTPTAPSDEQEKNPAERGVALADMYTGVSFAEAVNALVRPGFFASRTIVMASLLVIGATRASAAHRRHPCRR